MDQFCERILQIRSRLDFRIGSRGWSYILENAGVITKGELDAAQALINKCRKDGSLPLDICAEDSKRSSDGIERVDGSVDDEATAVLNYLHNAHNHYDPINFWDASTFTSSWRLKRGISPASLPRFAGSIIWSAPISVAGLISTAAPAS